ncbi:MAG: LPS-assembly protein LptD [Burkholderiales bacterium]|nr:LPS-assembly protein LptD [Burkholderiales bacterium]
MTQRRTRTAAIALAIAILPAEAAAQISEGLRLKLERQMRMAPARPERDSAKFLEADRIVSDPARNVVATGDVVLRQRGATIRADRVEYRGDDQTVVATGDVRLERDGDVASGPRLNYRLDTDTGDMDSPVFDFPKRPERRVASRGQAARAVLEEERKSRLFNAEYTSCPVPRDDWFIRVRELELDSTRNVGTAYNTTVFFLGVPILYSPYLSFPLDNRRKTGFLAPTFGTSARSGFEVSLPYYWNIAENYDATLTPKMLTRRGLQLGAEFRYLTESLNGQVEGEFLPQDRVADRDRYFMGVRHTQQLGRGWSFLVNAQKVSDDEYFRDLSTRIALTSQTNLPRDAILAYNDDAWSVSARALGYQTLQDPLGPKIPIPYNILPQLLAFGSRQNVNGVDWQWASDLSNFRHPVLVNGQRFITYPSIAYPLRRSYGYVIPKVGFHYTRYNLEEDTVQSQSRGLPIVSLDSGLYFERRSTWVGRAFEQTLEPRLFYLNVPYKDQTGLPNFTTAESDFNFQRFFTENRFVGGDRIGDANQLTIALTSRLIESATGLERFKAGLGQVYYFRPPRVTLGDTPPPSKSSDILGYASSQMSSSVALEAAWQYTPNLQRSEKITVGARYSPEPGAVVNAAYRYVRGSADSADPSRQGIQQVDLSTQWPITRNLSGLARWNWSTRDRKLLEGLAGFEYNAGCWQVRAVAHRFITATQQYSTSFQIQLELAGLSRIGINPLETLRQNIGGYRRSDEIAP